MSQDTTLNILFFFRQWLMPAFLFVVVWTAGMFVFIAIRAQQFRKYMEEKHSDFWKNTRLPVNSVVFALKLYGWYKDSNPLPEDPYIKNYQKSAKLILTVYFIPWAIFLLAMVGLVIVLFTGFK
ncbi:hypothetical protein HYZ05_01790 [Candidatus Daviesbacteria bacterium]|nr:hypothetical protein [Candidatus Daviesbacteria bacterium]